MNLDGSNYHSHEANMAYWSVSQVNRFAECPSAAIAEMAGQHVREVSDDMLIGSYVDRAVLTPGELTAWCESHKADMVSEKTKKEYAWVAKAKAVAERALRDDTFRMALSGKAQVIVTWRMFGVDWKCAMDSVDETSNYFADLKTCPSFAHSEWDETARTRLPWYDKYFRQIAVYRRAFDGKYGKPADMALIGYITKEDPPDIGLIEFGDQHAPRFEYELRFIKEHIGTWDAMKRGTIPAARCGSCAWCRKTKVLSLEDIVAARDWRSENRMRREGLGE